MQQLMELLDDHLYLCMGVHPDIPPSMREVSVSTLEEGEMHSSSRTDIGMGEQAVDTHQKEINRVPISTP